MSFLTSADWQLRPERIYPELHNARVSFVDGVWYLSRYADVAALLNHSKVSNVLTGAPPDAPLRESMLQQDPPHHGRIRSTVGPRLNKQPVQQFRDRFLLSAESLFEKSRLDFKMDFMSEIAAKLPILSMSALFLLDVKDIERLDEHVKLYVHRAKGNRPQLQVLAEQSQDLLDIREIFRGITENRAGDPTMEADVLDMLLQAEAADTLSRAEVLEMCVILTLGSIETTPNVLGSAMASLHLNPGVRAQIQAAPSLLPALIEEVLRLESPVKYSTHRTALEDININGLQVPKGTSLVGLFGAANRDPEAFERPNAFQLNRKGKPHLGFGYGIHYCVGAHFARLQAHIVLDLMFQKIPNWRISPIGIWQRIRGKSNIEWNPNPMFRGLRKLQLEWD
jgi:cytochrome P450